jgi:2-haloacid dehalogenase
MFIHRRRVLTRGLAVAASPLFPSLVGRSNAADVPRFKALAFDAFPIFDPRAIAITAEDLYPGNGAMLIELWRARQFEYTWLRTIAKDYADFMKVTEDALIFATNALDQRKA